MDSIDKSSQPLVSVMLIVKNGGPYVSEQIDSILAQTYTNLELIICDDYSMDRTPEIAQEYMRKDSRVKWVRNESNVGVSLTFQKQCQMCCGEFIAPSDADDFWLPKKIEKEVAYLMANPAVQLVFTDDLIVNNDLSVKMGSFQQKMGNHSQGGFISIEAMLKRNFLPFHVSCFRRSLLHKILPMPEQSRFMYDSWVGLVAALDHPLGYIAEQLVLYRQHNTNMVGSSVRDVAFYRGRLNSSSFLLYYYKDKSDQMAIHQRLLTLGGSDSARDTLNEKISIQAVLLEAMRSRNLLGFTRKMAGAFWTIFISSQKYHLKQWLFLAVSWGNIRKQAFDNRVVDGPSIKP